MALGRVTVSVTDTVLKSTGPVQNEFTRPRISVVIATYNRPELARRLLVHPAAQTMVEVVVVDDGSRTALPEIAVPYRLTVLRQENQGASAARHLGARMASGDVVLFLDDDMEIPNVLLDEHVRLHDEGPRAVQYLKVGGFDVALGLSEDAELGLRLEKDGATFHVSESAHSVHHSDHASLGGWLKRKGPPRATKVAGV